MKLRTSQTNLQSPYRNLSGYGYELIEVPKDTLDNRILFILDEILNNFQV
jgi:predicted ATPase